MEEERYRGMKKYRQKEKRKGSTHKQIRRGKQKEQKQGAKRNRDAKGEMEVHSKE
jgi:hypothetical protein